MTHPLVIVGCGGFGREVWAIVEALRADGATWEVEGFVDDSPTEIDLARVRALKTSVVGSVSDLADRQAPYSAVIAIGSPTVRQRIRAALASSPVVYPRIIHPDSTIGRPANLGEGLVVAPGARLSANITVGAHVHIDQNVTVGHDTVIGDFARLNPQACLSGSVIVEQAAVIGANATVLPGLLVGAGASIGASACVTRHVSADAIVKGVPAR